MAENITDNYTLSADTSTLENAKNYVWHSGDRKQLIFANSAYIQVIKGVATIGKHVAAVAYVAPVAADPIAEPPVEEVVEVLAVEEIPCAHSFPLKQGDLPLKVNGTVWLYNHCDAVVSILEFVE